MKTGGMKRVFKCKSLGMSAKRGLYEGVVVPMALYGTETWNMGSSGEEEIECNGDEMSEEYVWSNTNGSGEK